MKPCIFFFLILMICCKKVDQIPVSQTILFSQPQRINISGYEEDIMEAFLSPDGNTLFFNNSNDPSVNTNLHFAHRIDDLNFIYQGELKGVNTTSLEGVASMDTEGNFYFVSTREYFTTYTSLFCGKFSMDSISNILPLQNLSKKTAGWLNFDAEVSRDGNSIYFTDGRFDENGGPYEADLALAIKKEGTFQRLESSEAFKYINTTALEYAACISTDQLEIYFTRLETPISASSMPRIYVATRNSITEPFAKPYQIKEISGFVEAPALSPDEKKIYYHKKEKDRFVLYMVEKI